MVLSVMTRDPGLAPAWGRTEKNRMIFLATFSRPRRLRSFNFKII